MPSSFPIKRSPFLGWEKMLVRSFLLFENHTKLFRVTQTGSTDEWHPFTSIKAVVCFKRKSSQHDLKVAFLKYSLRLFSGLSRAMKVMIIIYFVLKKKQPTDSKICLLSLGSALRSPIKYFFKICFYSLELPMTIVLIFLLCYYIQPSPDEVW